MFTKLIRKSIGFSLIEVMIAISVLGGASMYFMRSNLLQSKTQKKIATDFTSLLAMQRITTTLKDGLSCSETFNYILPSNSLPTTFDEIKSAMKNSDGTTSSTAIIHKSQSFGKAQQKVKLVDLEVVPFNEPPVPISSTEQIVRVQLKAKFQRAYFTLDSTALDDKKSKSLGGDVVTRVMDDLWFVYNLTLNQYTRCYGDEDDAKKKMCHSLNGVMEGDLCTAIKIEPHQEDSATPPEKAITAQGDLEVAGGNLRIKNSLVVGGNLIIRKTNYLTAKLEDSEPLTALINNKGIAQLERLVVGEILYNTDYDNEPLRPQNPGDATFYGSATMNQGLTIMETAPASLPTISNVCNDTGGLLIKTGTENPNACVHAKAGSIYASEGIKIGEVEIKKDGTINVKNIGAELLTVEAIHAGGVYYTSDRRLKQNIRDLTNSEIEDLKKLKGKSFKWKKNGKDSFGLIAQDVEKVFPHMVLNLPGGEYKSVAYTQLIAPMIELIKTQQKEIDRLKLDMANLEKLVSKEDK